MENKREGFASNFGFIMAAVGSAVGLGNIWGFPYKMGRNGGFSFLLIYICLALFVGLAVLVGELAIGRKTGMSPIGAYRKLGRKFPSVGYMAVVVSFIISCFYFVLGGMVMRYAVGYLVAIFGGNAWMGVSDISGFYRAFLCSGWRMLLWTAAFIVLNAWIIANGVGDGIEKFCNIGMPCLFAIVIIFIIYISCQPGAAAGYTFMFSWNLDALKTDFFGVLKTAAGQMFFSLSLGMGVMITYGSYLPKGERIQKNAVIIVIMDTLVAIMAGMMVMPACFAFDVDVCGGPGLLFEAMQVVFSRMGGFVGNLMGFLFYFFVFIAAISSALGLLEAVTAARVDANVEKGRAPNRKGTAIAFAVIIFFFCIPTALDALGAGTQDGAAIACPAEMLNGYGYTKKEVADADAFGDGDGLFVKNSEEYVAATEFAAGTQYYKYGILGVKGWNDCWLDFYDMLSEGIMMPLGALIMALAIGWIWKTDLVIEECEASGTKFRAKTFFKICYKFITPIGMLFVLYGQITGFFG